MHALVVTVDDLQEKDFTTCQDKTEVCTRYYRNWPIIMLQLPSWTYVLLFSSKVEVCF